MINNSSLSHTDINQNLNENSMNNSSIDENFDKINTKFDNNNVKTEKKTIYYRVEDIIDNGSYNLKTFKIIFFCCLYIFFEGFYLNYFNIIVIPFKKYYNISNLGVSIISSLNLIGMFIGHFTTGLLSEKISRVKIIKIILFFILILHLILSLVHNIFFFFSKVLNYDFFRILYGNIF